jgi:hypothetical protein
MATNDPLRTKAGLIIRPMQVAPGVPVLESGEVLMAATTDDPLKTAAGLVVEPAQQAAGAPVLAPAPWGAPWEFKFADTIPGGRLVMGLINVPAGQLLQMSSLQLMCPPLGSTRTMTLEANGVAVAGPYTMPPDGLPNGQVFFFAPALQFGDAGVNVMAAIQIDVALTGSYIVVDALGRLGLFGT